MKRETDSKFNALQCCGEDVTRHGDLLAVTKVPFDWWQVNESKIISFVRLRQVNASGGPVPSQWYQLIIFAKKRHELRWNMRFFVEFIFYKISLIWSSSGEVRPGSNRRSSPMNFAGYPPANSTGSVPSLDRAKSVVHLHEALGRPSSIFPVGVGKKKLTSESRINGQTISAETLSGMKQPLDAYRFLNISSTNYIQT